MPTDNSVVAIVTEEPPNDTGFVVMVNREPGGKLFMRSKTDGTSALLIFQKSFVLFDRDAILTPKMALP